MKLSLLFVILFISYEVNSATFSVNSTNDNNDQNPGDGICADSFGQCTLRAATEESNQLPGADIIYLQRGVSYQNTFTSQLISDSLTLSIENPFTPITSALQLPQIIGNNDRVIKVQNATEVTFFGLLIMGGDVTQSSLGDQYGGGVSVDDVTTFNLLNSIVYQNRALTGAGLEFRNVDSVLVSLSDISYNENTAPFAGIAIKHGQINAGEIRIQHSSIHHNALITNNPGGCAYAIEKEVATADMYVFNSLISDNGVFTIPNNCVNGIHAASSSLYQSSDLYIVNSSIINNHGKGLDYQDSGAVITGNLFVRNTILANNNFGDCENFMTGIINFGDANGGYNITSDSSCSLPAISGNMQNTNPMLSTAKSIFPFADFLFIYYEPRIGSPAIDNGSPLPVNVGNPNACQQYDQLLRTRPIDGSGNGSAVCDIGAVEYTDIIFKNGFE